jgi:hypothetical protein
LVLLRQVALASSLRAASREQRGRSQLRTLLGPGGWRIVTHIPIIPRRALSLMPKLLAAGFLLVAVVSIAIACNPLALVSLSYVLGDVPRGGSFDAFMTHDLQTYFVQQRGTEVHVAYDLLRRAPTQSGTGYPKNYAWVVVQGATGAVEEGAVRMEAHEQGDFTVTTFLDAHVIRTAPNRVRVVFPAELVDDIIRRADGVQTSP